MKHFVNMKYKLKMDNIYIKGNADNYVTLDELNLNDIVIFFGVKLWYTIINMNLSEGR